MEESGSGDKPKFYVGIGASAGGLEAIETFFSHMPEDSGLAFIVIQHLSPDYKSMMVELLSKRTRIAVRRAEDGLKVEAGTIYLIPPKTNLTIFHGKLLLTEQEHDRGLNLPIDIFFRSLAEDQGERAVGIILSGTGSDGMRGIRTIKERGGMAMVQTIESAKFDGMPRSAISTGLADFILPPEEMAPQLIQYTQFPHSQRAGAASPISPPAQTDLDRLFAILRDYNKIDFTHYKPSTVLRRIERRMSVNQMHELHDYVRFLEQNPREVSTLYRELLIGVTSFFRDPEAFDFLLTKGLPELFSHVQDRELRLWVAGCSTGEEAYSLAILCREVMERLQQSRDVKIFATDIDQSAIIQASAGIYPASIVADLPTNLHSKYFRVHAEEYQVQRKLREMVVFAQHNLIQDPPFTNIDLISCRNLLIYLQPVLQNKVLELFNFSLNPGGLLVLGSSETCGQMAEYFEPLQHKWKIFRSRGRKRLNPKETVPGRDFTPKNPRLTSPGLQRVAGFQPEDDRLLERLLHLLAEDHLPLTLVVNEQMELLFTLGRSDGLLNIPSGRLQFNVSHIVSKELSIPLATSIQRAFSHQEKVAYSNITFSAGNTTRRVGLKVSLLPCRKNQMPLAAVFIEDTPVPQAPEQAEAAQPAYDYEAGMAQRMTDLEQELQFTKENLQATIEELETSNEELQATNEELLASNEELQSTNEELQSVNEELHTVNAEHQVKIMALTEMTNDLDNLLGNTRQGIVFLDENFEIRRFTPDIVRVLQIRSTDIGRPFEHLNHRLRDTNPPIVAAREVAQTHQPIEREVVNDEGTPFLMRVLPYELAPRNYSGLVLIFTDLSRLRSAEQALRISEQRLKLVTHMVRAGSWEYEPAASRLTWADAVYEMFELPPGKPLTLEEMLGFSTETSRPGLRQAFREALEQGRPFDLVFQIRTPRNELKWVRSIGNPIMANGRITLINGACQDVTPIASVEHRKETPRETP